MPEASGTAGDTNAAHRSSSPHTRYTKVFSRTGTYSMRQVTAPLLVPKSRGSLTNSGGAVGCRHHRLVPQRTWTLGRARRDAARRSGCGRLEIESAVVCCERRLCPVRTVWFNRKRRVGVGEVRALLRRPVRSVTIFATLSTRSSPRAVRSSFLMRMLGGSVRTTLSWDSPGDRYPGELARPGCGIGRAYRTRAIARPHVRRTCVRRDSARRS